MATAVMKYNVSFRKPFCGGTASVYEGRYITTKRLAGLVDIDESVLLSSPLCEVRGINKCVDVKTNGRALLESVLKWTPEYVDAGMRQFDTLEPNHVGSSSHSVSSRSKDDRDEYTEYEGERHGTKRILETVRDAIIGAEAEKRIAVVEARMMQEMAIRLAAYEEQAKDDIAMQCTQRFADVLKEMKNKW